ncbi:MAG TPA: phage terminase large subunit [Planctomycetota bacterium]|nr:phage terminase large subunit [Planctomycetota bacterium]
MSGDETPRDPEAPEQPALPTPHAGQDDILNHKARFRIAVCGRRFGKTVAAAIAAVRQCEDADKRQRVWWISPIQEQSDRVEREIAWWLSGKMKRRGAKISSDENGKEARDVWEHHKSEHAFVYMKNGSRIEFHSAQAPDHLRGAGLDLVIIDEAADVSEYTWKHVIKPMLLESRGRALILGTPRGTQNWLHKLFLLGNQPEHDAYKSFQKKSSDNPKIEAKDLEEYKLEMTDLEFRQEFDAEFIDGAGSVFPTVLECVGSEVVRNAGRPGCLYATGIDLADQNDWTVICSISITDCKVEGFWRFHKIGWFDQRERIANHLRLFPGPCLIDSTGVGDPIVQDMMRCFPSRVAPFRFNAQKKNELVKGLGIGLEKKMLTLPKNAPELISELQSFQCLDDGLDSGMGLKRYGAPKGLHDDCVMALALAWWAKMSGEWGRSGGENVLSLGMFA